LWHQPVFVFARLHFDIETLSGWHYFGLSCLCVVLAILSWFFVEQPFRKKVKRGNRPWLFKMAAMGSLLLLLQNLTMPTILILLKGDLFENTIMVLQAIVFVK